MLTSIVGLPWSLKILYGIISDNVPIYGSRRKSYLVIMSALQSIAMLMLACYDGLEEKFSTILLMIISLTVAVMDVIVDSIMVI